jgi:hypothetical protein
MTHYHKERDAFEEHQKRCTRNMPPETPPIKTATIGTDKVIDYAENAPAPPHWNIPLGTNPTTGKHYKGFKVTEVADNDGVVWIGIDKAHDKGDETVTWPTEERIDNIGQNGPTGEHYMNKYQRKLTSPVIKEVDWKVEVIIDVYDVLDAFDVSNPATAHAIKKLLCTGSRGVKDWETDLQEAIDSLERAKSFPPIPF